MIFRLIAGWFAVGMSAVTSLFLFAFSRWAAYGVEKLLSGKPLPVISSWFYPPSIWPYGFPLLGLLAALACSIWGRDSDRAWMLCITLALGTSIAFLAVFLFSIALPWIPFEITPLQNRP
jgi:hypothetical protein